MNLTQVTNTGRFNYHLKALGDLIEKLDDGRYRLTERGQIAVQLLEKFPEKPAEPADSISKANVATRKAKLHTKIPKKPLIAAVLVLLIGVSAFAAVSFVQTAAETLPIEWQQYLPGISGYAVIQASDGGYLALGENASLLTVPGPAFENFTLVAVKTDSLGNVVWAKNCSNEGTHVNPRLTFAVEVGDGYVLAGQQYVDTQGQVCLMKIDFQGDIQWTNTYREDKLDAECFLSSLFLTNDGGFALIGFCTFGDFSYYLWLAKTDAAGNLEWSKPISPYVGGPAIFQTSDQGYIILGSGSDGSVMSPLFYKITTINSEGETQWFKTYGGEGDYHTAVCSCGVATADGGYVLAGSATPEDGQPKGWIVKTDAEGNMLWNKLYSYNNYPTTIESISQANDGDLMFMGTAIKFKEADPNYAGYDPDARTFTWIAQIDNLGNIQGQRAIDMGNHVTSSSFYIMHAVDGGHVFAGTWDPLPRELDDQKFWLVKIADFHAVPSLIWLSSKIAIVSAVIIIEIGITITTWKRMQKTPLQNNGLSP